MKLVLVALKYAPVHRIHMMAYRDAIRRHATCEVAWVVADEFRGMIPAADRVIFVGPGKGYRAIVRRLFAQFRTIRSLTREVLGISAERDPVHVLVQAPHPANPWLIRRIHRLASSASVRYYLHEPTSLWDKIRKTDGVLLSLVRYVTQYFEVRSADMVYVGSQRALNCATRAFRPAGAGKKVRVLPLPFIDLCSGGVARESAMAGGRILLLGRADERRCLSLFYQAAIRAHQNGDPWRFVVLTASSLVVPAEVRNLPNLELKSGAPYSDEEMVAELRRARFVFNLYGVDYMQSGVSPVAMMCGAPLIALRQEYDPALAGAGCLFFDRVPTPAEFLAALASAPPPDAAAIRQVYLSTHDSSGLRIPA